MAEPDSPRTPDGPSPVLPVVRYMTVSDELRVDPSAPRVIDILGLLYVIRSLDDPPHPLLYREICVFLALAGGRGNGTALIVVVNDDTGTEAFRSAPHPIAFGSDPLKVTGVRFRLRDCTFPAAGMYAVQFWYNTTLIDLRLLSLR